MPQAKPDLVVSDIIVGVPRKLILNIGDMSPGVLTLIEALDIGEASGFDTDDFEAIMKRGTLKQKARLMYAFGWVVARRVEPDLTFDEVLTYNLEVRGNPVDAKAEAKKAETVVAVAALAGVSPDEAKNMTVAEVAAVTNLQRRRNVSRTTPRRRKAG